VLVPFRWLGFLAKGGVSPVVLSDGWVSASFGFTLAHGDSPRRLWIFDPGEVGSFEGWVATPSVVNLRRLRR